jgi:hypothetical protein
MVQPRIDINLLFLPRWLEYVRQNATLNGRGDFNIIRRREEKNNDNF